MKVKIHLYTRFERFWHWFQAFLIILLLITGFEVHGTIRIFGYGAACRWHNLAGLTLLILTAFAIFWHLTTGQWRHYQPTFTNFKQIVHYYLFGISFSYNQFFPYKVIFNNIWHSIIRYSWNRR